MHLYALKDKACGIVHVFTANNEVAAKRTMAETMERNPNELIYRYSEDFDLLKIAEMDSDTGAITETETKFVCNLTSLKRDKK